MERLILVPIAVFIILIVALLLRVGKKKDMPVSDGKWENILPEDIGFFGRMRGKGYTEVAFAVAPGSWIELVKNAQSVRIVGMWVFFHPNGGVAVFEWHEYLENDCSRRLPPRSNNYTLQSFAERLEIYGIRLTSRSMLSREIELLRGKTTTGSLRHQKT